jgi:hypothetical protein
VSENTQTAEVLGYGLPTTLSEQSTYTISKGHIFGMGAVFENKVKVKIKGHHVVGAGAYYSMLDQSQTQQHRFQ